MISTRLRHLLEQNGIPFEVLRHDPAFSAQQLAARMHVRGREFVKAVVVKLDGRYAIAALPAHRLVDEKALARVAGAARCELATETEFRDLFPECEVGAMPPVGRLYDLPTYVDEDVTRDERIVANAGTHAEAIRLRYQDLALVARPTVGRFGVPSPAEQPRQRAVRKERPARPKATAARRVAAAKAGARKKAARKKTGAKTKTVGRKKAASRKKTAGRKGAARRKTARARKTAGKPTPKKTARGKRKTSKKKATRKRTAALKKRHS